MIKSFKHKGLEKFYGRSGIDARPTRFQTASIVAQLHRAHHFFNKGDFIGG